VRGRRGRGVAHGGCGGGESRSLREPLCPSRAAAHGFGPSHAWHGSPADDVDASLLTAWVEATVAAEAPPEHLFGRILGSLAAIDRFRPVSEALQRFVDLDRELVFALLARSTIWRRGSPAGRASSTFTSRSDPLSAPRRRFRTPAAGNDVSAAPVPRSGEDVRRRRGAPRPWRDVRTRERHRIGSRLGARLHRGPRPRFDHRLASQRLRDSLIRGRRRRVDGGRRLRPEILERL
jgi:hypothetical protein